MILFIFFFSFFVCYTWKYKNDQVESVHIIEKGRTLSTKREDYENLQEVKYGTIEKQKL